MPRPDRTHLARFHGATVADLVGDGLRLLFVGINPGLWTAATNTHFAYPGNRFYPALELAGLGGPFADPAGGLEDGERDDLIRRGIGITNVVARATARAAELSTAEIRAGGERLTERIADRPPRVVTVLGLTVYRTALRRPDAVRGLQPDGIAGVPTFVFGNPSGLNAHESVDSLAAAFRQAAAAAGVASTRA
jgi:TDG/mug DNA glycosylase family protein